MAEYCNESLDLWRLPKTAPSSSSRRSANWPEGPGICNIGVQQPTAFGRIGGFTMGDWVVLLGSVNVGGRGSVKMAALREAAAAEGLDDPESYVQSGNLVVGSRRDKAAVEEAVRSAFRAAAGFDTTAFLRSAKEWRDLIAGCPFLDEAADPTKVHAVLFGERPADDRLDRLRELAADERIAMGKGALYLHAPSGVGKSRLVQRMSAILGVGLTMRNWRTVTALAAMLDRRATGE